MCLKLREKEVHHHVSTSQTSSCSLLFSLSCRGHLSRARLKKTLQVYCTAMQQHNSLSLLIIIRCYCHLLKVCASVLSNWKKTFFYFQTVWKYYFALKPKSAMFLPRRRRRRERSLGCKLSINHSKQAATCLLQVNNSKKYCAECVCNSPRQCQLSSSWVWQH